MYCSAERERRAKVLEARGNKEAMILKSEGEKESQINQAEAEKQTQILKAQGEADATILQAAAEATAIEKVTAAIERSKTDPATYMLLTKYIESLKEIAAGDKTKTVFLPFEASNLVGALGSLTSLLEKNNKELCLNCRLCVGLSYTCFGVGQPSLLATKCVISLP